MNAAMILCAGYGTRLQEITKDIPKPMLLINDKPMLEYTIIHLSKLGFKKIVINLHYLAEKITSYFQDGKKWNIEIDYIYEDKPLGTAGAVKNAESLLIPFNDFLVLYGDVISNQNYLNLLKFHESTNNAVATIVLHERLKSNSIVEMDFNQKITRFVERPKTEITDKKQNWVNSGLYCFNKKIFNYIPKETFCDFPKDIFPLLLVDNSLYGYPLEGYRCAVDSVDRYINLQKDILEKKIF